MKGCRTRSANIARMDAKQRLGGVLVRPIAMIAAGVLVAGPVPGHHSDAAIDINSIVNIEGVVTEYSWRNPHVYFTVETDAQGEGLTEWTVQMAGSITVSRMGWTRDTLTVGDRVFVGLHPARDGRPYGLFDSLDKEGLVSPTSFDSETGEIRFVAPEVTASAMTLEGKWMADGAEVESYVDGYAGFTRTHIKLTERGGVAQIAYDEFSRDGLDISLEFSNKLKKIKEKGKNPARNIRISTALPISYTAIYDEDMKQLVKNLQEKSEKDEMSRQRFFDCFIGPKETTLLRLIDAAEPEGTTVFSGALNETGLVHIRNNNGKLEITLSEHGFEFSSYDNPIINGIKIIDSDNGEIKFSENVDGLIEKKPFSNEERTFIMNKIIPKFKLEKIIIENILQKIKNEHEVNTETLDEIIINTVSKWKTENEERARDEKLDEKKKENYRIATMGRLAEIGEVEWDIKEGKSIYSIST